MGSNARLLPLLVVLKGIKHYGVYREKRKETQQLAIDWFNQHLK